MPEVEEIRVGLRDVKEVVRRGRAIHHHPHILRIDAGAKIWADEAAVPSDYGVRWRAWGYRVQARACGVGILVWVSVSKG